jgi:hypothetical protein
MIAGWWPENEARSRYRAAAGRFRIPYWDWASDPSSGESVFPMSVGGSPYVDVDGPSGVQRIANPLFSYTFKPLNATAFKQVPVSCEARHSWNLELISGSSGISGPAQFAAQRQAVSMQGLTTLWWRVILTKTTSPWASGYSLCCPTTRITPHLATTPGYR